MCRVSRQSGQAVLRSAAGAGQSCRSHSVYAIPVPVLRRALSVQSAAPSKDTVKTYFSTSVRVRGGGVHKFFNLLLKKKGASVSVRPPFDSYLIISQQARFENLCHKFPN